MPFDLRSLIPVIGGAAPHGGGGFLRGWQRAEEEKRQRQAQAQQAQQQQQQGQIQQEQLGFQRDANGRANASDQRAQQDQALQAVMAIRQLLGDEAIDTPEGYAQREAFATALAPRLGVDAGFVSSLRPSPDTFTKRTLGKLYTAFEKMPLEERRQFEAGGAWTVGSQTYTPAQVREALGVGGVNAQGQPFAFARPATLNTDEAPLDRRYLTAGIAAFTEQHDGRAPNATELQGLIREARKVVGQADDRPPSPSAAADPEMMQLRKDLLATQIATAKAKQPPPPGTPSTYMVERVKRNIASVDALMAKVGPLTTGIGSALTGIRGSSARNFNAELVTLKSNIAFSELTAMREASKTGGALGNVSDQELSLLTSTLGALDTGQSPANFKAQLQKIKDSLIRWQEAQAQAGPRAESSPPAPTISGRVGRFEIVEVK